MDSTPNGTAEFSEPAGPRDLVVVLTVVLLVVGLLGWFAGGVLAAAGCGGG